MGKKTGSESGMNHPDHISESFKKTIFGAKILKFFDVDPGWIKFGCGMEKSPIRDTGSTSRARNTVGNTGSV